jgi:hypothetical protein
LNVSVLQRHRSLLVWFVALLVSSEGACDAILGLDAPTLAPCGGDCSGATDSDAGEMPTKDATTNLFDSDATSASEAALEGAVPDAPVAVPDVRVTDASRGVPCGIDPSKTLYCPLSSTTGLPDSTCCLTFEVDGGASYACVEQTGCSTRTQYPIECASADDCSSVAPLCCFNNSAIKCEANGTTQPCKAVCDPSSGVGCPAGHACNVPLLFNGYVLPYESCSP